MRVPIAAALAAALAGLFACSESRAPHPPEPTADLAITTTAAIARARATTFGANGFLTGTPDFATAGGRKDRLFAADVDPAGRLLVVGQSERRNGSHRGILMRFTIDGRFDPTFGGGDGIVLGADDGAREGFERAMTTDDAFYGVRVDKRGRIIVVGRAGLAGKAKSLIARYRSNGTLDTEFGDFEAKLRRGFVIGMGDEYLDDQFSGVRPETAYPDESLHAVDVDASGRIVAAGLTSDLNKSWLAGTEACKTWLPRVLCREGFYTTLITRWTDDGQLDTSFNEVGWVTGSGGRGRWWLGRLDEWHDMKILSDGRIITAGFATGTDPKTHRTLLAAFLPSGKLDDTGFGSIETRGFVLGPERARAGGAAEVLASVALDPHGKLIEAGTSLDANGQPHALVARTLPNGTEDATFAAAGFVLAELDRAHATVRATVDDQGMIVVAAPPRLHRYSPSGALDETFSAMLSTTATGAIDVHDLIADRFGKIYVIGARGTTWYVARYKKNGRLDRAED